MCDCAISACVYGRFEVGIAVAAFTLHAGYPLQIVYFEQMCDLGKYIGIPIERLMLRPMD